MVLQLENIVDVFDVLYSVLWDGTDSPHHIVMRSKMHPTALLRTFEYLFLTDH